MATEAISLRTCQAIGMRIADRRRSCRLSQERLAELIGLSRAAVGKIERGEVSPNTGTVLAICETLNCTPNDILLEEQAANAYCVSVNPDKEMTAILNAVTQLTPEQRERVYAMMGVVISGIANPIPGLA